jgi:hypothetical protein
MNSNTPIQVLCSLGPLALKPKGFDDRIYPDMIWYGNLYFNKCKGRSFQMKLNGTHKFKASSAQVFNAILNPEILKSSIPGCEAVVYASPSQIVVDLTTPLPGLRGPIPMAIDITNQQAPNYVELQVLRNGKGGSINAVCKINIVDEAGGALLSYDAKADLEGMIAVADNPIGQPIVKNSLNSFFKNLDKALEASLV